MKFLLILPLLVSATVSTFFVHKNNHKDGLTNSHILFLGYQTPELLTNIHSTITGDQNVNTPVRRSFWARFGYPYHNYQLYPTYQSSGFISQAQATHPHITGLTDKWPIIAYREIEPVVAGADIPMLVPISSYGSNPISKTTTESIEETKYGRNNLNASPGPSTYLKENTIVGQKLPLALGRLSNGVTPQPSHYLIQTQSAFQPQTVVGHYNKPSQPWMDNYSRCPLKDGDFQGYPGADVQYHSQMRDSQRYPQLGEKSRQYFTALGIHKQYTPQSGASQRYSLLGGAIGQFLLQGTTFQRYPPLSGGNGQFVFEGGVNGEHSPLEGVNEKFRPKGEAVGRNPLHKLANDRYRPKTGGFLNSRLKENNPSPNKIRKGLVSGSSTFKEDVPKDRNDTKAETVEKTDGKVIDKGLVAIKAPSAKGVGNTKTEVVVEKGLTAIEAPSNGEVKGDVKNKEAIENNLTNIKAPSAVEGTKPEEMVEKGLIATEAFSREEVKDDVRNEAVKQNNPTNIEASHNKGPSAEGIKTEVIVEKGLIAIGASPSGEQAKSIQNGTINNETPDNKITVDMDLTKLKKSVDVAESPLIEVVADTTKTETVIGKLAEIKGPFDKKLLDVESINEANVSNTNSGKEPLDKNLVAGSVNKPNETEVKSGREIVGSAKFGPEEVDTEPSHTASVNSPSKGDKIIGKEYISEITQKPVVSEEKIDVASEISLDQGPLKDVNQPGTELHENKSKIRTRDTTNIREEPQTISFTIYLPPKTITTKTVSQIGEHKTRDGKEVNLVPIQRLEIIKQKSGSNVHIEPTITNGPNGVQITIGSAGNIGVNQQEKDLAYVFNLGSILGLTQSVANGENEQSEQNKPK